MSRIFVVGLGTASKELRTQTGWSQSELGAEVANLFWTTINRWENRDGPYGIDALHLQAFRDKYIKYLKKEPGIKTFPTKPAAVLYLSSNAGKRNVAPQTRTKIKETHRNGAKHIVVRPSPRNNQLRRP